MAEYFASVSILLLVGLGSYYIEPYIGYRAVGFLFLLTVLIIGIFGTLGTVILSACLSTFAWNYFFIHPKFTFRISTADDFLMCLAFFVVALITGFLTNRIRYHENVIREREQRTNVLYEVLQIIASANEKAEFLSKVTERVGTLLLANCGVFLKDELGMLIFEETSPFAIPLSVDDQFVAQWSFEKKIPAGWSTIEFSEKTALFIPLVGQSEVVGVFIFRPLQFARPLEIDKENLLYSIVSQLGISIERHFLRKRLQNAQRLKESEELHQTLLNSISHEMRTPLTAIIGSASALENQEIINNPDAVKNIATELQESGDRLNRVIENLLDMSRLDSGVMSLKFEWHELNDLLNIVRLKLEKKLMNHKFSIEYLENAPLMKIDFRMMEHAISNVVLNAALYTPEGSEIKISSRVAQGIFVIKVQDNGFGVSDENKEKIFSKFYRIPGSPTGGTGLGLSIVKSIVELHKGYIKVVDHIPSGACFQLGIPVHAQPDLPKENAL